MKLILRLLTLALFAPLFASLAHAQTSPASPPPSPTSEKAITYDRIFAVVSQQRDQSTQLAYTLQIQLAVAQAENKELTEKVVALEKELADLRAKMPGQTPKK